jgi:hypothetical protein
MYELSVLSVLAPSDDSSDCDQAARPARPMGSKTGAVKRDQARNRRRITCLPDRGVADQLCPGGGVSAEGHARGEDAADRSCPAEADALPSRPVALFAEEG